MPRTLVTGAAGFTGRFVASLLASRGHAVHGLVHAAPEDLIEGVAETHVADLTDPLAVQRVVAEVRPEYVVHLAAIAFVAHGDVEQMYRTNVVGTRNLLEALADQPNRPESVLVASSANIYGNAHEGMLEESTAPAPANDYGVSKLAMEFVAGLYAQRLPLIVVRPFNYTGFGQEKSFVIPKIIAHVREKAPVIELGNLDVARDFSDVRIVVDAYARLLSTPAAIGETINICSGRPVTLREVIDLIRTISGHDFEVRTNPAFVRANEVRTLWGSLAKLERLVGPVQPIALEDTLRWMLES